MTEKNDILHIAVESCETLTLRIASRREDQGREMLLRFDNIFLLSNR